MYLLIWFLLCLCVWTLFCLVWCETCMHRGSAQFAWRSRSPTTSLALCCDRSQGCDSRHRWCHDVGLSCGSIACAGVCRPKLVFVGGLPPLQWFSVLLAASPPLQRAFDPVSCQQVFDFACVSFSHSVRIGHTIPSPCRRRPPPHRPCQAYSGPPAPPPSSLSRCEAWSCRNGLSPTSWTPRPCWSRSSITNTLAPERPRRSSSICTSSITVCRRQWSWVAFRSR